MSHLARMEPERSKAGAQTPAGSAPNRSTGHGERMLVGLAATSDSKSGGVERSEGSRTEHGAAARPLLTQNDPAMSAFAEGWLITHLEGYHIASPLTTDGVPSA